MLFINNHINAFNNTNIYKITSLNQYQIIEKVVNSKLIDYSLLINNIINNNIKNMMTTFQVNCIQEVGNSTLIKGSSC